MLNRYATRTYNLQANVPISLPAAREYIIVGATLNIDAIFIALGDGNADLEQWAYGLSVGVKESTTKARLMSSVAQSVTITMSEGDVRVVDARFAPGPGSIDVNATNEPEESVHVANTQDGGGTPIALVVGGSDAANAAPTGNPVRVGARTTGAALPNSADNTVVDLLATPEGAQVVRPFGPSSQRASGRVLLNNIVGSPVLAAPGAGLCHELTSLQISGTSTQDATQVTIRNGTSTFIPIVINLPAGNFMLSIPLPGGLLFPANDTVVAQLTGITTGSVTVCGQSTIVRE